MDMFRAKSTDGRLRLRVRYDGSYAETQARDLGAVADGLTDVVAQIREWAATGHMPTEITVVLSEEERAHDA